MTVARPEGNRPVEILILNWNGLDDTFECVHSVLASVSRYPFIVRVIDNGSDGNDCERLREQFADEPRVRVEANEVNLGFARGMNQAMKEALSRGTECMILLNNDTVVEPDWLGNLVAASSSGSGLVASRMDNYYEPERLDNAGHCWMNTGEILPRGSGDAGHHYVSDCDLVGGCGGAVLFTREVLEEVGLFDPYFHTGYEDAEHGLRAFLAGYPTRYCADAVVRHKVSRSIDKIRDFDYSVDIQKNINYTILKLTPWPLLVLNGPFMILKTVLVPLTALLFGRWSLARAHVEALRRTFRDLPQSLRARRASRKLRRISAYRALRAQRFFLATYWGYFRRYLLTGKPTVFER